MSDTSTVDDDNDTSHKTRTELNIHANMFVLGKDAYILNQMNRTAQVNPFSPEYESMKDVPIVDAALAYNCPYTAKTYILIIHNALSIPSMNHNLNAPFIMREAGLIINDIPKIHVKEQTTKDHSIWFPSDEVRIPLSF